MKIGIIKGITCKQCNGNLALAGFIGNFSVCLECGLVYSTEILEKRLGHGINFKEDIDYLEGEVTSE